VRRRAIAVANADGIKVDDHSRISSAIIVKASSFDGGISNAGTLSAGNNGILALPVSTIVGGIVNAGVISRCRRVPRARGI
jgi:hypothetical protein